MAAMGLKHGDVIDGADPKALQEHGKLRPWAIRIGNIHTDFKNFYRNFDLCLARLVERARLVDMAR
ncbi:hypothetical protein A3750_20670 [Oleiphilus sp. HI0079]|nr:hypothetical protein A3750_20670 [Oleiphilus sp. HI0079]